MNIKITYNWLLEYLDTDADPYELQKYLSLCGPSIERVDRVGNDYVLDIEITSNRVDMASVFGIAQEAQSILPQFGKRARLKFNPLKDYSFNILKSPSASKPLQVVIENENLCSRFTAIILTDITIGPSPDIIRQRLQACDINSINNVIDISNYLMLALGQPTHTFDYDKISGAYMHMRESKQGEFLITLDSKQIKLPGGDIVIEDKQNSLIDLCGIMGGENSMISENTKNVLLFVQTYNKRKIRKTSMTTGQRSVAATYFEKGLDENRVESTLVYGVQLLQQYSGAHIASKVYDMYPKPYIPKTITVSLSDITRVMGIEIMSSNVQSILENLGFQVIPAEKTFIITVPSWRKDDISIKEDIVEEVARVYGYHRLPNTIQKTTYIKQPQEVEALFSLQQKIKYFLKHIGVHESMNYSMISEELLKIFDLKTESHLVVANTISEEIKYMRTSLIPSLAKNIKDNSGKQPILKFFEIAKVYSKKVGDLPNEQFKLGIAVNTDFFDLKGIVEAILRELHIDMWELKPSHNPYFSANIQGDLIVHDVTAGTMGQLKPSYVKNLGVEGNIFVGELDFTSLIHSYKLLPSYKTPNPYAVIKLDVTIKQNSIKSFSQLKNTAFKSSKLLHNIEVIDTYKDNLTIRFYFSSPERNITEEDAKNELATLKL